VLRHRILLSFSAEAGGITTDKYISELLARVPVP
jgi:MoxR-like ATPase